jgi:hypothetical protein
MTSIKAFLTIPFLPNVRQVETTRKQVEFFGDGMCVMLVSSWMFPFVSSWVCPKMVDLLRKMYGNCHEEDQ